MLNDNTRIKFRSIIKGIKYKDRGKLLVVKKLSLVY